LNYEGIRFLKVYNNNSGKRHVIDGWNIQERQETLCGLLYWNYQFQCEFWNFDEPDILLDVSEIDCHNCGYIFTKNSDRYIFETPDARGLFETMPEGFTFDQPMPMKDRIDLMMKYPDLIDAFYWIVIEDEQKIFVMPQKGANYMIDIEQK
jgi:hypothetical protein